MFLRVLHNSQSMAIGVIISGHVTLFCIALTFRISIYRYIRKKLQWLQSILDLLILDLIRVETVNHIIFIFILLAGYFHGQIPFLMAQFLTFLTINILMYLFGLCQFFLMVKAVLIFKGYWLNDVSEVTIIWTSRLFALVMASLRFVGDFSTQKGNQGLMIKFLTGIDKETSINTGAFYLAVVMMVFFSYILLRVSLRRLPTIPEPKLRHASQDENIDLFKKPIWIVIPTFLIICLTFGLTEWIVDQNNITRFTFVSLVLTLVKNLVPLYYIMKVPNLKKFALNQWNELCERLGVVDNRITPS